MPIKATLLASVGKTNVIGVESDHVVDVLNIKTDWSTRVLYGSELLFVKYHNSDVFFVKKDRYQSEEFTRGEMGKLFPLIPVSAWEIRGGMVSLLEDEDKMLLKLAYNI